jgi:hypothetical protein
MERRPIELRTTDDDRPSVLLPPMRSFIGPTGVALMVAAPVLLLAGWQAALIAGLGAAAYRELDRRVGRAGFSLGDGFLPYRSETGWPHGVREDDDVRWNWAPVPDGEAWRDGHPARG